MPIKHLSPTSITLFLEDRIKFYKRYMLGFKGDVLPQTLAMSVGSSFDAYIKSYLHEKLFGKNNDPKYTFQALFESQVEIQNRDKALIAGDVVFQNYIESGGAANLLLEMNGSLGDPKFEIEVFGRFENKDKRIEGDIILTGKPDVFFINADGILVIIDWKVNGYYSDNVPSPMQGYVKIYSITDRSGQSHKDACLQINKNLIWNSNHYLNLLKEDWGGQLTIYSWLGGNTPGEDFICGIDQLVCNTKKCVYNQRYKIQVPSIRVAIHRLKVEHSFQEELKKLIDRIWWCCHSGHFFDDLTIEESQLREESIKNSLNRVNILDQTILGK